MRAIPVDQARPDKIMAAANGAVALRVIEPGTARYQEPLVITLFGGPGTGKSRLIGTAPDTIGLLPLERKSRQSVLRAAEEFGRRVILPEIDLIRTGDALLIANLPPTCIHPEQPEFESIKEKDKVRPIVQQRMQEISNKIALDGPQPNCCRRHYYRWFVNRMKSVAFRMAAMDEVQTIAIDPFGQFVMDVSYANYGIYGKLDAKEFGHMPREDMNTEVRDFLNNISHKNLILTHHAKEIWKDNKPTSKHEARSEFYHLGHYTSVMVEMERDDDAIERNQILTNDAALRRQYGQQVPDPTLETVYKLHVRDCQANVAIIGNELLRDKKILFTKLAMAVYQGTTPGDWE